MLEHNIQWSRQLRWGTNALLLAAIVVVGVALARTFMEPATVQTRSQAEAKADTAKASPQHNPMEISRHISSMHLLGRFMGGDKPALDHAPVTHLDIKLKGVIAFSNRHSGLVLLDMGGSEGTKLFRVGDAVMAGVKIYDVERDAIVLSRHGHLERLNLLKDAPEK